MLRPAWSTVAQILLTRKTRARHRHNAVCNTIGRLLANGAVPIVNENDTVSATEIKFGDNDTLSALVASVVHADMLFILSNIPGLIDIQGSGEVVPIVDTITDEIEAMAHGTEQETSVGGMVSKISAAKIAQRAGCAVIIGSGGDSTLFKKLLDGESVGTYFAPSEVPVKSHKRWIAIQTTHMAQLMWMRERSKRSSIEARAHRSWNHSCGKLRGRRYRANLRPQWRCRRYRLRYELINKLTCVRS